LFSARLHLLCALESSWHGKLILYGIAFTVHHCAYGRHNIFYCTMLPPCYLIMSHLVSISPPIFCSTFHRYAWSTISKKNASYLTKQMHIILIKDYLPFNVIHFFSKSHLRLQFQCMRNWKLGKENNEIIQSVVS